MFKIFERMGIEKNETAFDIADLKAAVSRLTCRIEQLEERNRGINLLTDLMYGEKTLKEKKTTVGLQKKPKRKGR